MAVSHIEHILVAADDIDATRDWYARVLGMTSGPHPDFGFPVHWMYVNDVDKHHEAAKAAGATILNPPADQFYGDRTYGAEDPEGHHWSFAQHVKDVAPEDMHP